MVGGLIRLSAVLPIFAERESITDVVSGLCTLIGDDLEEIILVVAKSSPEETFRVCKEVAAQFPVVRISVQKQNPGLGLAVRQGIAEARGTHILMMDSDGEMDVHTVPQMLAVVKERDADLVVASRWMRGGGVEGYNWFKYVLNRGYQGIFRLLYWTPIHDLTLGFKLGRAAVLKSIPWSAQFHDIACETTLRVIRAGYAVAEVPTVWRRRKEGVSTNPFRRNFRYVSQALSILCGKTHKG
jgi:dolichol-phosphate mannosyltransferase